MSPVEILESAGFRGMPKRARKEIMIHFLIHDPSDDVAVAVVDIAAGTKCRGKDLATNKKITHTVTQDIPLGHKFARRDCAVGETLKKYGTDIGKVVQPIKAGQHVHVHNLKTKRW
jgi:(2R)-sulfolactate sulfo-lyase subunit alpha